jgi:hypothetical protein
MGQSKTEKIKVDLVPVLATLETLAENTERIKQSGIHFSGHHLMVPGDFPVDFMQAAKSASEYVAGLPKDDPAREVIDHSKVSEGYRLLNSGEITVVYIETS